MQQAKSCLVRWSVVCIFSRPDLNAISEQYQISEVPAALDNPFPPKEYYPSQSSFRANLATAKPIVILLDYNHHQYLINCSWANVVLM